MEITFLPCSRKLTIVDIRKAVLNHFLSLPQSSDCSLRVACYGHQHSIKSQKRFYEEWPLAQKRSKALDLLGSAASLSLGEGSVEVISNKGNELNINILPVLGKFKGLVAGNSTNGIPEVFVA